MSSVIDEVWKDMKGSDFAKTRTFPSKVDRLLFGSKQSMGKPKRSYPKHHTGAPTTLARYPQTPRKPSSALDYLTSASKADRGGHRVLSLEPETGGIALDLSRGTISADEIGRKLLADWLRYKNGVADSDVSIRKAALQSLSLGLHGVVNQYTAAPTDIETNPDADPSNGDLKAFLEDLMAILMDDLAKTIFKSLADPAEACRSAAICAVTTCVEHVADLTPYLVYLFPVIIARGVPPGYFYDPSLELFVHDIDEHEAYKRGRATERQDLKIPMMQRTPEDSEELRLSLCQMVGRMITTLMARDSIGVIGPYLDDIILFLVSNSNDVYSPVKVEALAILAKLAVHPQLEQGMKFYAVGLSRSFLPILRHRHAKVRIAAIEALSVTVQVPDRAKVKGAGTAAIVDLVGFREDNVIPVAAFYGKGGTTVNYLAELATDINVSVRLKIAKMLGDWLTSLPDRYDHQTRLLPYVLHAIADDAEDVSAIALETLSQCGEEYEREHQNEVIERRQFGVDGDNRVNHAKPLPRPFSSRPRIGARLFVRGNARRFLLPLLVELSDWMNRTRLQSAKLFRTLIVYCEEHLTVETHKLIPYLQRALEAAIYTKDEPLEKILLECCQLVGRYLVAESYLPHILARIREEPEVNPTGNRATLLTILSKLLEGSVPRVLILHMPEIIDAITARCQNIAEEPTPVRVANVRVLSVVAKSFKYVGRLSAEQATFGGTGRFISTERPVRCATGYLLACQSLEDAPSIIEECLNNFAGACQLGNIEMLVTASAAYLVEGVCENYPIGPLWHRKCYHQLVLEALFDQTCPEYRPVPRTCPEILPPLLHLCEEILAKLSSFKESDREGVLIASLRFIILRAVRVWGCDRDSTSAYDETMSKHARCILYLCTDACWDSTPALQHCQLEILGAVMENRAWRESLSDSVEASCTASNVMATLVGLLSNPAVRQKPEDSCKILEYMAQILSDSVSTHGGELSPSCQLKRLTPFPRRNATEVVARSRSLSGSPVVADAYRTVLARLGDNDDSVCRCALETLGEFLHYVQADIEGEQLQLHQRREVDEIVCIATGKISEADESTSRDIVTFSDFVTKCVSYFIHDMTCISRENGDVLDTLLRRVASLDPRGFEKIISRFLENPGAVLTQPAMELLSQLIDHARVLSTLQKQGS